LVFEGGYANDPVDRGGETFRGISRKNWPRWAGWDLIDHVKRSGITKAKDIDAGFRQDAEMEALVSGFYRENFWAPFERLDLPPRATAKLFDTAVNVGVSRAIKFLQESLNVCGERLVVDGKAGPATKAAINACTDYIVGIIAEKQADFYRAIAADNPSQSKFLKGWLRRADWIPEK
jgi:lysozyme family protein